MISYYNISCHKMSLNTESILTGECRANGIKCKYSSLTSTSIELSKYWPLTSFKTTH